VQQFLDAFWPAKLTRLKAAAEPKRCMRHWHDGCLSSPRPIEIGRAARHRLRPHLVTPERMIRLDG